MMKIAILMFLLMSTSAFAYTNSTILCVDNDTLVENITVTMNGNETSLMLPVRCTSGCDNTTFACSPPVYQQNLTLLGAIFVIFLITALVIKWKRGR